MGGFPDSWAPGEHITRINGRASLLLILCRRRFRKAAAPKGIEPVITLSSGEAKQIEILYVEPFDVIVSSLTGIRPGFYGTGGYAYKPALPWGGYQRNPLYQYFPPAPDKRRYVDDRIALVKFVSVRHKRRVQVAEIAPHKLIRDAVFVTRPFILFFATVLPVYPFLILGGQRIKIASPFI